MSDASSTLCWRRRGSRFRWREKRSNPTNPRAPSGLCRRAVWAACPVLARAGARTEATPGRGPTAGAGGDENRPNKVEEAGLLGVLDGFLVRTGWERCRRWARAFLATGNERLREIAATVAVVTPGGSTDAFKVPVRLIENHLELRSLPLIADGKGEWVLHLDRPLSAALRDATRAYREPRRSVLLANGQTCNVSKHGTRRMKRDPGDAEAGERPRHNGAAGGSGIRSGNRLWSSCPANDSGQGGAGPGG